MDDERVLSDLKSKIENIRSEILSKEGERKALLARVKKEFGIDDMENAYKRLKDISKEIDSKQEKRHSLLKTAQERLANYG